MAHKFYKTEEMKILNNLYTDLDNYNRLSEEINIQLKKLHKMCINIIIKIASTENFNNTFELFDQLEWLQSGVATIIHKYNYTCNQELYNLVKDLDRLDDIDERKYWFEHFKKNKYEKISK